VLVVRKAGTWDDPVNRDEASSLTPAEMSLVEMLLGSWSYVIGAAGSAAVVSAIIRRDADAVVRGLGWDKMTGALEGLPETLAAEVVASAGATNLGPGLNLTGAFEMTDPRAIAWAQRRAGQLIVEITDQQRGLVRNMITEALRDGITVDATAARIKQVVGLHDRYAQAVMNSRQRTYESLIKAGLSPAVAASRADALADSYRQRLLQSRATTIARTEILAASNQGRYLAWQEGVNEGLIDPDSVKEWRTAPGMSRYGPPCVHCLPYNGIRAKWDQPFSNGAMMPPLHPNCRCTAVILPPDKGITDNGELGKGEGWEDDGQTFAGTRCDLCPGNCGRRFPVNLRVIKSLTVCSGLPGSAPENAVPVDKIEEVDPGDVIYFDGSTGGESGLQVIGPGAKPGTLKVKSSGSKGSTYDLSFAAQAAKGKKFGLVPGPIKIAKAQAFSGTPDAPLPPLAPAGAIPITKASQVHPGDILYTSKQKNAEGYTVLGTGPNGGILYYSPGAKKKFEIDIDAQSGKTAFAIVPGPEKTQHVLGTLGPSAKPPGPSVIAGGDPNPTMWQPKLWRYTALKDGNGGTGEIIDILPNGFVKVKYAIGVDADGNPKYTEKIIGPEECLGMPTGSLMYYQGEVKQVHQIDGNIVKFTDGTQTTFGDGSMIPASATMKTTPDTVTVAPPKTPDAAPVTVPDPTPTTNPNGTLKPTEGDYLPPFTDSFDLLGTQTGGPTGSNTGKPGGFWTGKDGKKYYVKAYANPDQAFQEMLANRLYAAAGVKAPRTTLSTWTDPDTGKEKVLIATEIIDNQGTVGSLGLTAARAKKTVDGFAADAWLANFDAVGTGLDNIVVLADGTIARIDAGGSLLFRAQGNLKVKDPTDLHEVDLGAFFTQNQYYKQVLTKAGVKSVDDLDLADQVALLRKTVDEAGGTKKIVDDLYEATWKEAQLYGLPLPLKPDLGVLADLLEARLKSLEAKYPPKSIATGKPQVGETLDTLDFDAVEPGLLLEGKVGATKYQFLVAEKSGGKVKILTYNGDTPMGSGDWMDAATFKTWQASKAGPNYKVKALDSDIPTPPPAVLDSSHTPDPKNPLLGDKYKKDAVVIELTADNGDGSWNVTFIYPDGYTSASVWSKVDFDYIATGNAGISPFASARPFKPQVGFIVSSKKFPANSYKVVEIKPDGSFVIESKTGKKFTSSPDDVQPVQAGTVVYVGSTKYEIQSIDPLGKFVVIPGGKKIPWDQLSPATKTGVTTGSTTYTDSLTQQADFPLNLSGTHDFSGSADWRSWGQQAFDAWRRGLKSTEISGLSRYTGSSFRTWNRVMRNGGSTDPGKMSPGLKATVQAINRSTLPEDLTLFRGIQVAGTSRDAYASLQPGDLVHDHSVMSTSLNPSTAQGFSGGVLFVIRAPRGTKGAYLGEGAHSSFGHREGELLLGAGTTLRVDKVYKRNNGEIVVEATVVDQSPTKAPSASNVAIFAKRRLPSSTLTALTPVGVR